MTEAQLLPIVIQGGSFALIAYVFIMIFTKYGPAIMLELKAIREEAARDRMEHTRQLREMEASFQRTIFFMVKNCPVRPNGEDKETTQA